MKYLKIVVPKYSLKLQFRKKITFTNKDAAERCEQLNNWIAEESAAHMTAYEEKHPVEIKVIKENGKVLTLTSNGKYNHVSEENYTSHLSVSLDKCYSSTYDYELPVKNSFIDAGGLVKDSMIVETDPFVFEFELDSTIEDHGMKTSDALYKHINKFGEDIRLKFDTAYKQFKVTLRDPDTDQKLMTYSPALACYAHIGMNHWDMPTGFLRQKTVVNKPKWIPRWRTYAWTLLNRIQVNNRKPILKMLKPKHVPADAAFVVARSYYDRERLEEEGYIETIANDASVEVQYQRWRTVTSEDIKNGCKLNEDSYSYFPEKRIVENGSWIRLTPKGIAFYNKTTAREFRMINCLNGDPRMNTHAELNSEYYQN